MIDDKDNKQTNGSSASNILEQYKYIVDDTNIVSKADKFGNITYANHEFIKLSGYSLEELLGRPHSILRNPDTPADFFKKLWDTIQAKKVWRGVITNVRKDFKKYTVEASIYPIMDVDGEIIEYISIRHDITELKELHSKIKILHQYDIQQQNIAREKLEAGIVNELSEKDCKVIYNPSDIVSGDFYSIFKRDDGSIFLYILDGQGHGVSPGLTVFAISATIKQLVNRKGSLKKLRKKLFPTIKTFLGDIEQLSYTMIMISSSGKKLSYVSAGMYPMLIKNGDEIVKIKTNNLPFMEFSEMPKVDSIDISGWESMVLHSDGIVEHEYSDIDCFTPDELIHNPSSIDELSTIVTSRDFDDDLTLIYLKNSSKIENV